MTKFEMLKRDSILCSNGSGLGDVWATINYAITYSYIFGQPLKMSINYRRGNGHLRNVGNKVTESVAEFRDSDRVIITQEDPTHKPAWYQVYSLPYFPTKLTWQDTGSKIACYQFDGKSHGGTKNFPDNGVAALKAITDRGLETLRLGDHLSLHQCVELLSKCAEFHGVNSGMAHLAHSVGCPVCLYANKKRDIEVNHRNKTFTLMD